MPEPFLNTAGFALERLWHRCFPENFAKFLRTPFLQNTSGGCFWIEIDFFIFFEWFGCNIRGKNIVKVLDKSASDIASQLLCLYK